MSTAAPLRILIAALGGDGGGVLAAWISQAAVAAGLPVSRTSIPGLAQRTGATSYYLELLDRARPRATPQPVLSLYPAPGCVDVLVATEFVEAGRMMLAGYVTANCTHLVASTHRTWTITERGHPGDGRFPADPLHAAASRLTRSLTLLDAQGIARRAGCAANAVLLGAVAACRLLPLETEHFKAAIQAEGKAADANLRGFTAGFSAASATSTARDATRRIPIVERFEPQRPPPAVKELGLDDLIAIGIDRATDYQNAAYAELYRQRIARVADTNPAGPPDWLTETARQLALLMTPEDAARVAQLKVRSGRLSRLRESAGAAAGDIVRVTEYLKPGRDEIAALLPASLGRMIRSRPGRSPAAGGRGLALKIRTSTVSGYLLLRILAAMRRIRPWTEPRRATDQLVDRWLFLVAACARRDPALAFEVARSAELVKGYGDTRMRGERGLLSILDSLADETRIESMRAADVSRLRRAALADEDGRTLDAALTEVTP